MKRIIGAVVMSAAFLAVPAYGQASVDEDLERLREIEALLDGLETEAGREPVPTSDNDAFGLPLGAPLPDSVRKIGPDENPNGFLITNIPAPFPGFTMYVAIIGDNDLLCGVTAMLPDGDAALAERQIQNVLDYFTPLYGSPIDRGALDGTILSRYVWLTPNRGFQLIRTNADTGFDRGAALSILSRARFAGC